MSIELCCCNYAKAWPFEELCLLLKDFLRLGILQNSLHCKCALTFISVYKKSWPKKHDHHILIAMVHGRNITESRHPFESFKGAFACVHTQYAAAAAAAGQTDKCNQLDLQINFGIVRQAKMSLLHCWPQTGWALAKTGYPLWLKADNPFKLSLTEIWRLW